MSGLGWKLKRLQAMGAQEIWHRTKIAVRDRISPPRYEHWDPIRVLQEAGEPRFPSSTDFAPHPCYRPWAEEGIALLNGQFSVFGRQVALADPPNWRANAWTGQEWPDAPSRDIPYRRADIAGGVKYAWEIGRLTMLTSLAIASHQEPACRTLCIRWLNDFALKNPLLYGVHHTSGIEMGVRNLVLVHVLRILGNVQPDEIPGPLALALQQAWHCRDHLSLGSSANNHLLAEYAGMAAAATLFPSQDSMFEQAILGLEAEVVRQFSSDGISLEQSFGYLPFIWELILYPFTWARERGRTIDPVVLKVLANSLQAARWLRHESGSLPQIGDEDDGRVLLPADVCSRLDLVGTALAAFLDAPGLNGCPEAEALSRLLLHKETSPAFVNHGEQKFSEGGYSVWHKPGLSAYLDHGPLGLGSIAAHGHADCLSVVLARGLDILVVDPGVYAYQEDPEGRDRFRGTPYHSTVQFGNRNQSEIIGPFMWGKRAIVEPQGQGWECTWYTGEKHWRCLEVDESELTIRDRVTAPDAFLNFVLHPDAEVTIEGIRATVTLGKSQAIFIAEGTSGWVTVSGEYSRRLGHKQPTLRLQSQFLGFEAETRILFADRE